uniref:UDP-glycosyltransferases domain-containing protein n=1 Tax=Neobodo designis TaxID=312471 RepID=A0A7S1M762_NEODS|mmetsp:Transcript_35122/g.108416  ORF Transcript_35122/g.108416 Transcript_35122/m.108416 type:complete len:612 (+) Transcript_35122:69-1904(+)
MATPRRPILACAVACVLCATLTLASAPQEDNPLRDRAVALDAASTIAAAAAEKRATFDSIARFPRIRPDSYAPEGAFPPAPERHHIVLATIPMYGHFMPIKALGEALLRRGHDVTVMTEKPHWCETPLERKFGCVQLPPSGVFAADTMTRMTQESSYESSYLECIEEMANHHENASKVFIDTIRAIHANKPVTGVISDASTIAGFDAALAIGVPVVTSFPVQLHYAIEPLASLPAPGAGNSRWMSYPNRVLNFAIKALLAPPMALAFYYRLNRVREANGIPPFKNVHDVQGLYGPVLAPTVWGHDMPHAICPNVFPLGTLVPAHEHVPMEPELAEMLASHRCATNGTLYVNFGTLTQLTDRLRDALIEVVTAPTFQSCVVWKPNPRHVDHVSAALQAALGKSRVFVAKYLNNPPAIMAHRNVWLFITHCGDTSVGEAMEAGVPLAGIPQFADQPDVCQRITEGGFGVDLGHKSHVTAAQLSAGIEGILNNATRRAQMRAAYAKTRASRRYLGGPQRGAQIVEAHLDFRLGDQLTCAHIDPVRLGTVDAVTGAVDTRLWVQAWAVARTHNLDSLMLFSVLPTYFGLKGLSLAWRRLRRTLFPSAASSKLKQE